MLRKTRRQFRTPRHIIDLIVALVNPQPGLRICDPACGTAGFLISSYTHILRQHTKPVDLARGILDGSQLKPKQWEFLEQQAFTGFDNDANMVKIGILNPPLIPQLGLHHRDTKNTEQETCMPKPLPRGLASRVAQFIRLPALVRLCVLRASVVQLRFIGLQGFSPLRPMYSLVAALQFRPR
ncbi:MAG: N-6 DNA methylase [Opitutaceae bacterium]